MALAGVRVERWTRGSVLRSSVVALAIVGLFAAPTLFEPDITQRLTGLWILVLMGAMWNALAGYGGLVSVGQQAFIGVGAYATIYLTHAGLEGYTAMALAIVVTGILALVTSFLVLRLRGGEFAIAMWVVAEVFRQVVSFDSSVGGGTGISLTALNVYGPDYSRAFTYWWTLAAATIGLIVLFLLLRSRSGAALQAIRDDETAAASLGVRVLSSKRLVFVVTSTGCGAAGAAISPTSVHPAELHLLGAMDGDDDLLWSWSADSGRSRARSSVRRSCSPCRRNSATAGSGTSWASGTSAILFALFLPRGIWGTIADHFDLKLDTHRRPGSVVRPAQTRARPPVERRPPGTTG